MSFGAWPHAIRSPRLSLRLVPTFCNHIVYSHFAWRGSAGPAPPQRPMKCGRRRKAVVGRRLLSESREFGRGAQGIFAQAQRIGSGPRGIAGVAARIGCALQSGLAPAGSFNSLVSKSAGREVRNRQHLQELGHLKRRALCQFILRLAQDQARKRA